ncbi:MAG TPA: hypothetical protein VHB02_16140 [Acidimicrobiales bacterium]|nr:hypothetical protein [Acidimicrobiales bacterium]
MPDDVVTAPGQTDLAAPLPPVRRTPGMRPALVVLGIAVLLVLGFGLLSVFTSGSGNTPPPSARPARVPGTSLLAVPAGRALGPVERGGVPPANIVHALTIPKGATVTAHADDHPGATGYDQQVDFTVPGADQASVVAFYKAQLDRDGWRRISVGPATNRPTTTQVLAQAAGSDGWYWEAGALVSPTTFGPDGAQSTAFTIRLFQVPDEN